MIHQIYCTHCTYGTSVLDQREGELADRVLGYSTRAASLTDRNELRGYYRQIERFLSYYLPVDTPPEEKPRLDAAGAPRRLFVCPAAMDSLQMVGQVSYRSTDTAGRVGSYFAHVLFASREPGGTTGAAWSPLEALRLWQAPWADRDSNDLPFVLPTLDRLDDLWAAARPALDDNLVLSFLNCPAGEPYDDPAQVIPPRWSGMPIDARVDLVVHALQGFLKLGSHPRRGSVILVAEPGMAALVFYCVARLLPGELLDRVSFSTFEPTPERMTMTLAATTFYDPDTSDVRPDLYRRGGLVLNTYTGKMSEGGPPSGNYARFIVERLLAEGWTTVDRLLESFQEAGAKRPEDLEELVATHKSVSRVLSAEALDDGAWRGSSVAANYLRREVRHQLAQSGPEWPELRQVAGSPNHLLVLELVAGEAAPADLHGPAQFLLSHLPPEKFPELLASPRVAPSAKVDALQYYVTRNGRLPDGCETLWADETHAIRATGDHRPLVERLCARLPEAVLLPLYDSVAEGHRKGRFLALLRASRSESRNQAVLKRLVLRHLNELDDAEFIETIVEHREALRASIAAPEPALAERLVRLLYELPSHPKHFQKWLAALELWVAYFPEPDEAERRLADWRTIRQTLESLRDEAKPASTGRAAWLKNKFKPAAPRDLRSLAEALGRAMRRRPSELEDIDQAIQRAIISPDQVQKRLQVLARITGLPMPTGASTAAAAPGPKGGAATEPAQLAAQQDQMQAMLRAFEQRALAYADDDRGSRRQTALRHLGMEIVRRPDFLPAPFWTQLGTFFEYGDWSEGGSLSRGRKGRRKAAPAGKGTRRKKKLPNHFLVGVGTAAAILAIGLGAEIVRYARRGAAPSRDPQEVAQNSVAQNSVSSEPPSKNSQPPHKSAATAEIHDRPVTKSAASPSEKPTGKPPKSMEVTPESSKGQTPAASGDEGSKPNAPDKVADKPETGLAPANEKPPANAPASEPPAPTDDTGSPTRGAGEPSDDADPPPDGNEVAPQTADQSEGPPSITASLPSASIPRFQGNAHDYAAMLIWSWDAPPKGAKLVLCGLDLVNRHLNRPGKIDATNTDDGLDVTLVRAADGARVPLAKLRVTKEGLSFQWAEGADEARPVRDYQEPLRRCAVKVQSNEQLLCIALSQPSEVRPLELSSLAATLGQEALKQAIFPPWTDEELMLGPGRINFKDGAAVRFGQAGDAGPPYRIQHEQSPGNMAGLQSAQVDWSRDAGRWRVEIGPDDPEHSQKKTRIEDNKRLLLNISNWSRPIKKKVGGPVPLDPKRRASWDGRVAQLAKAVAREPVPKLPASGDAKSLNGYWQEVGFLLNDAERKAIDLEGENKRIENELRRRQPKDLWGPLRANAVSISAIVYRRVEADVQAEYLIMGDPAPPRLGESFNQENDE